MVNNDYTSVSTKGLSVVDYCIVPYEYLSCFTDVSVVRARKAFDEACITMQDPTKSIPDHSLLKYNIDIEQFPGAPVVLHNNPSKCDTVLAQYVKYDVTSISADFVSNANYAVTMNSITSNLEQAASQDDVDTIYKQFCEALHTNMDEHLPQKLVQIKTGLSNKRRRFKKTWWTDELTGLWDELCGAEEAWTKGAFTVKPMLKQVMKNTHKVFDRAVQRTKRRYWHEQQEKLLNLPSKNPKTFWKLIGQIGVAHDRKQNIPMEVILDDGTPSADRQVVLEKWANDFHALLNPNSGDINSNPAVLIPQVIGIHNEALDREITTDDVSGALRKANKGKAAGLDSLPVEVLANAAAIDFLLTLYNKCFQEGIVPTQWQRGIITPIPKCSTSDPRVPLNYRGITLASNVCKLYCFIINERLTKWVENQNILCDEQNGFRKNRTCNDHLSTMSMLIETRKKCHLSTYTCFIDFSKAYDRIDRNMLMLKLKYLGINDNSQIYRAICSIYRDYKCCVRINGMMSDWFDVNCGLKQGCLISPLLFNLYINDLVSAINTLDKGIQLNDERISLLLYADDIVLLAENESDIQSMLNVVHEWCTKWSMQLNTSKTKIVHFRPPSVARSSFQFMCGKNAIDVVADYKYLGLIFTEHLDYSIMAKLVAASASRALGLLIAKSKAHGGMPFNCYTKLYDALVDSIINYGAAIWGVREFSCISSVQHRACRFFLGVGRYAPNAAVQGDMGWKPPTQRQWICVMRQWCRLVNMPEHRISKKVFGWAHNKAVYGNTKNWVHYVIQYMNKINMQHLTNIENEHCIKETVADVDMVLTEINEIEWYAKIRRDDAIRGSGRNKLRTYKTFKEEYKTEPYVYEIIPKHHRSALAKFRSGVAPLRIETGRYERNAVPADQRKCFNCLDNVEDEFHVVMHCPVYNDLRQELLLKIDQVFSDRINMDDDALFKLIMSHEDIVKFTASYLFNVLRNRRIAMS